MEEFLHTIDEKSSRKLTVKLQLTALKLVYVSLFF